MNAAEVGDEEARAGSSVLRAACQRVSGRGLVVRDQVEDEREDEATRPRTPPWARIDRVRSSDSPCPPGAPPAPTRAVPPTHHAPRRNTTPVAGTADRRRWRRWRGVDHAPTVERGPVTTSAGRLRPGATADEHAGPVSFTPVIAIWDGADNQTLYEILYMVHLISIVAAFGPLFLYPRMTASGRGLSDRLAAHEARVPGAGHRCGWQAWAWPASASSPSPRCTGSRSRSGCGSLRSPSAGSSSVLRSPTTPKTRSKKMSMGIGITHLVFVVSLWLMIFKPFVEGTYVINT